MNATKTSKHDIKTEKSTDITVIEVPNTTPNEEVINMIETNDRIIACPAIILANRRTVNAKGLVKIPKISIKGIKGTGAFNHVGTSGQNISFQYSFVPNIFTAKNVIKAKNKVTAILPVTFPPPGKKGTNPIKLLIKMKKNAVNK